MDYKDFKVKDKKGPDPLFNKANQETPAPQGLEKWWLADEEDLPGAVMAQVNAILNNDRNRIANYLTYSRLYGSQENVFGLGRPAKMGSGAPGAAPFQGTNSKITFNLVQSCIDSLTSKLVKSKPQPYFLTSKGDSKIQRKAKKLNDYTKGIFYQNDAYSRGKLAFRDAAVWGVGVIHVFGAHGRIFWERVMPYELFTDFLESHYGQEATKTLHRLKLVDRVTLAAMFPDKKEDIAGLGITADIFTTGYKSVADSVSVIESWRLPSAPDADDGVHCITSQGVTLFVERYSRPTFPFAIIRYNDQLHGFWGQGLAEQLMPIQVELNRCLMSVQRSLVMGGTFKILMHAGSKVVPAHFDDRIGTIIKWSGDVEPKYVTPPMVQPEIYQQIQTLKNMGYEQSGVSQLSAASLKPAGLDSGKALRESVDIESDRFQAVGQAYEAFYLDLARLSIEEAKILYGSGKALPMKVPGKRFIETVDFADCDLEDDQYVLQCFPISKLPSDPAGRLQTIQEMMQAGLLSPENGRRLLDFPDLDAEENLANAQLDYIHKCLDDISEGEMYIGPEPDDNLASALKLAIEYLAVGKRDNLAPDRLSALRDYISQCNDLLTAAQPPPAPAAPGAVPPANPAPAPTSDILPNINK